MKNKDVSGGGRGRRLMAATPVAQRLERRVLLSTAYVVTNLGKLDGYPAAPSLIADNGDIFGYATDASGVRHPFLDLGGKLKPVSKFFAGSGVTVAAMNNYGELVGWWLDSSRHFHPFAYNNGAINELALPTGATDGEATAINDRGSIVGFSYPMGADSWSVRAVQPLGSYSAHATAMNNVGQIAGDYSSEGFFIYKSGQFQTIAGSVANPVVSAINDSGQVVGSADITEYTSQTYPFLYADGKFTQLSSLGGDAGRANDINSSGVIVGSSDTTRAEWDPSQYEYVGHPAAFVDHNGIMTNLNYLVDPSLALNFSDATSISDAGQIVAKAPAGNMLLTPVAGGSISGTVWDDHNGNSHRDPGDGGLAGFTVFIDANNNGALDVHEQSTVTDAQGNYHFDALAPGTYSVRMVVPDGSEQTLPLNDQGRTIRLSTGQDMGGQDFANRRLLLYRAIDLGSLGGNGSSASALNDAGQIVGQATTSSGQSHAFVYDYYSGKMTDLGTLGGLSSSANAINNAGQIVGDSETGPTPYAALGTTYGFLYSNGAMTALPPQTADYGQSTASGINDAGQVIGTYSGYIESTQEGGPTIDIAEAFLYQNGTSQILPSPNGDYYIGAAINNSGQLVVNNEDIPEYHGPVWSSAYLYSNGQYSGIGYPDSLDSPDYQTDVYAYAMDDLGAVVGSSGYLNHAFYFNGSLISLGTLARQNYYQDGRSNAVSVNNDGWIVGNSTTTADLNATGNTPNDGAFLYHAGQMMDLNDLIAPGSGWGLTGASAINSENWIVGQGVNPQGRGDAFLLVPVLGSITGNVYADWNGDGAREHDEWNLPGRTVYIDANHNGRLDPGEPTAVCDAGGNFAFNNLAAGTYDVRQVLPVGWRQTTPGGPGYFRINLEAGDNVYAGAIGSTAMARISGTVFKDFNSDGIQSAGDPGLAGTRVFLDLNGDGKWDSNEPSALTDAAGHYAFLAAPPGSYAIREVITGGLHPTHPAGGSRVLNVMRGQTLDHIDFGNI